MEHRINISEIANVIKRCDVLCHKMKKIRIILILASFLLTQKLADAQDSIKIESLLSIETKGQHNIAALNNNFDCFNCVTGKIEDNPIHHLAIYTGLNHLLILNDKFSFETGLYLEERSHSGGNNTLSNLIIFPKILLKAEDSICKNGAVRYLIKGGDLWSEDIGDMLRIYNIDYQGIISKIYINNFSFGFMTIGDLSKNIGLDLHQLYKFSTEYNTTKLRNETSLTINELFTQPRGTHPTKSDFNIANYSKFKISNHSTIEGQLDIRVNRLLSTAIASGLRYEFNKENFNLKSSVRYYSENFNIGYNGDKPRYYWTNNSYVGPQLYPLKNFYRDLSQWALYTHNPSSDLLTIELSGWWKKNLYKKLSGYCEFDINYIYQLNNDKGSIFPIYNLGVQVDFLPVFTGRISVTNKHIELRNYYQTMSISRAPFLSFAVNLKLEKIRLRTIYMKS